MYADIEGDVTPTSLQYQNVHWEAAVINFFAKFRKAYFEALING